DGVHTATVLSAEGECGTVRLGMTEVSQMEVASDFYFLNTGSLHYVTFVPDVRAVDVAQCGATIRWSPRFAPEGTNVNFVQILAPNHLRIRTFERGVEAETLACGTGATASALAAAVYAGNSTGVCRVEVEGGVLEVAFRRVAEHHFDQITLTGPACRVFTGRMAENF
ncbi:MAG: diaminopimelate epimerase, partial [Alistipes sp.]|nr:diaminopimelate epimerase [Alistipes sp.]